MSKASSKINRPTSQKTIATGAIILVTMLPWATVASAPGHVPTQDQKAVVERIENLLAESERAMAGLRDYTGVLVKRERFDGEIVTQTIAFKFSRPFKVYLRFIEPHGGREGIYVDGWNENRIRLHRGAPFDFSANWNPRSRGAMRDNHYPVTAFGLERMLELVVRNIQRGIERGDTSFILSDGGLLDGEPTWCIEVQTTPGEGRVVTVEADENLWQLAERTGQNMYVILHHNDDIDSPTDIREGQRVFVPYHYASRGKYFMSKRSFLVVKAVSWDHEGRLYESYHYRGLRLNPGLTDADFDPRNETYGF